MIGSAGGIGDNLMPIPKSPRDREPQPYGGPGTPKRSPRDREPQPYGMNQAQPGSNMNKNKSLHPPSPAAEQAGPGFEVQQRFGVEVWIGRTCY